MKAGRRLTALGALAVRDVRVARTYRAGLALEVVFGLMNLAVVYFVGQLLDTGTADLGAAPSYFDFAAVGITLAVVVEAAVAGIALRIREEQLAGTLEELIAQPISPGTIALGLGTLPVFAGFARVIIYLVVGITILDLEASGASWLGVAAILVLTTAVLLSFGIVAAALTLLVKRVEVVIGLAAFALGILGGAFFPIDELPGLLSSIAEVLPVHLIFDGFRDALFAGADWEGHALGLLVLAIVSMPLALLCFQAAVAASRRRATLSEY